jgi:hypothetical protein
MEETFNLSTCQLEPSKSAVEITSKNNPQFPIPFSFSNHHLPFYLMFFK